MEEEMNLGLEDLLEVLGKRIKLIIAVTVLATLVSGILSYFVIPPTYEASTTIIVGKPQEDTKNGKNTTQYNDVMMYQNLVKTYSEIAKSNAVAEKAVDKLGDGTKIGDIGKNVTVTPQQGTQILEIKTQNRSAENAVKIVDAVAESFIEESKAVFPTGGDIQIMDKAKLPKAPVKPKKALNVAIAFFLGLMVSVGISFMLEYMDKTIKTEVDINRYLDLPVIGIIPKNLKQQ